jgi:hypothetical protein
VFRFPPYSTALNLDFLLYTADRDLLPLESWVIRVDKESVDENVHVHSNLYHQMSTLLKSVMAASRVTPTFRYYVKKQSPETFVILYRVYEGEPDLSLLGEGQKCRRIGLLPSPFGAVNVDLHYRTRMEILPEPVVAENTTSVETEEDNVFNKASIPVGHVVPSKGSRIVAVSPVGDGVNSFSTSPLSQDLPFSSDSKSGQFKLGRSSSSESTQSRLQSSRQEESGSNSAQNTLSASPKSPNSFPQRSSSYNSLRLRHNSFPFASLLIESQTYEKGAQLPKVPEDPGNGGTAAEQTTSPMPSTQSDVNLTSVCPPSTSEGDESGQQINLQQEKREETLSIQSRPTRRGSGDSDDEIESSDDSYVKVFAFPNLDDSTADIGTDLSEFVKEFRLAPEDLASFFKEQPDKILKQVRSYYLMRCDFFHQLIFFYYVILAGRIQRQSLNVR